MCEIVYSSTESGPIFDIKIGESEKIKPATYPPATKKIDLKLP